MNKELVTKAASWFLDSVSKTSKAPEQLVSENETDLSVLFKGLTENSSDAVESVVNFYRSIAKEADNDQLDRLKSIFYAFVEENSPPEYKKEILICMLTQDTTKAIEREKNITEILTVSINVISKVMEKYFEYKKEKAKPKKLWEK
jgi:hypothetical protein